MSRLLDMPSPCSGSQQERVHILQMALREKGVISDGAHYKGEKASTTDESKNDDDQEGVYL